MTKLLKVLFITCLTTVVFAQEKKNPADNYIIKRLIICNDNKEILMAKYGGKWSVPPLRFNKSETYNESLDALASNMGVRISSPKLAGVFSFKYSYTTPAALRMFYLAKYTGGKIRPLEGWEEVKWMSETEVIALKNESVYSLMASKIIEDTSTLWGGAFYLYKEEDTVLYKILEDFYPLR
ncbi:NUDIX hydrolase [Fulvivirga sp. M361]|uniref:NUDIX hydrolase n=1 Tax=Fulvivirga sp. M361 TaxID=2594266 RepID=UPI00117AEBEA|nr:NUDIX hydrolase [Fulvivirga sp. M361]TRX62592.1 NUDIX hydrolase [Fulvivirga sp. M361]